MQRHHVVLHNGKVGTDKVVDDKGRHLDVQAARHAHQKGGRGRRTLGNGSGNQVVAGGKEKLGYERRGVRLGAKNT
ncbi:MAG: hypothetical protein ACPGR8_09915 [Limisphaerales bacterium]